MSIAGHLAARSGYHHLLWFAFGPSVTRANQLYLSFLFLSRCLKFCDSTQTEEEIVEDVVDAADVDADVEEERRRSGSL